MIFAAMCYMLCGWRVEVQKAAKRVVEPLALEHQWHFVNAVVTSSPRSLFRKGTLQKSESLAQFLVERPFAAAD